MPAEVFVKSGSPTLDFPHPELATSMSLLKFVATLIIGAVLALVLGSMFLFKLLSKQNGRQAPFDI